MPDIIDSGPYQGWSTWRARNDGRFVDALGDMMFLKQPDGSTRTVIETGRRHSNGLGFLHGGFLMSFIDMAMFTAITDRLGPGIGAVTLSCATEFLGGGRPEQPLEAHTEVLAETGKLFFVRGLLSQENGAHRVSAYTGTMRKITRRPQPPAAAA